SQSVHHPALHSFPTRRSSDLSPLPTRSRTCSQWAGGRSLRSISWDFQRAWFHRKQSRKSYAAVSKKRRKSDVQSSADIPSATRRSEEHTSELQSPCNLVCRLL